MRRLGTIVAFAGLEALLLSGAAPGPPKRLPLDGAVHSVRGFGGVLSAAEVAPRYAASAEQFAGVRSLPPKGGAPLDPSLLDGPLVTFAHQREAVVRWDTPQPRPTILEYGRTGEQRALVRDDRPRRRHEVRLRDLHRNTDYTYRVRLAPDDPELVTPEYPLSTEADFSIPPLPDDVQPYPSDRRTADCARAAEAILADSGTDRGYCLDYGCGDGRLAFEIAKRSQLQVVGVSTDRKAVAEGRRRLLAAGLYGSRVTLRHVASLSRPPFPDLSVNLIVSGEAVTDGRLAGDPLVVARQLRPLGGKAYLGTPAAAGKRLTREALAAWAGRKGEATGDQPAGTGIGDLSGYDAERATRIVTAGDGLYLVMRRTEPLPGAGSWTHAYGDAGQTANSHDELLAGEAGTTLEVQWFGLPGPNVMVDRQVRMESPVSAAGRLFTQGLDRIIAQDAYNGTILWSVEIPGLRRTNIPRNAGNVCVDSRYVFAAVRDRCWRLDAQTGRRSRTYGVPGQESDPPQDWGFLAVDGGVLLGSAVRRGNTDTEYAGPQCWFDSTSGPDTYDVCSDALFALRAEDGRHLWTHRAGLVINPTISLGDGRVYFLETRHADAVQGTARKLGPELSQDVWLVALDAPTGRQAWERPFPVAAESIVAYTVYHLGQVAVIASHSGQYHTGMFAASDGSPLWSAAHAWRSDNHGHHIQHPVVAEGRLFLEPVVYDWRTGRPVDLGFPPRSKCGTISGAAQLLHYRDFNDEVWDLRTNVQSEFTQLRSNCWIGMISGNGLLMSPASGGGCGCPWPIYTSLTYRTKDEY